jgi:ribosomal protein S18 acetylase RimI-like enzyme
MSHLIAEGQRKAREWTGDAEKKPQWLVLMVHRDNARAARFYQRCGFEVIPDVVRKDHLVMKLWIGD